MEKLSFIFMYTHLIGSLYNNLYQDITDIFYRKEKKHHKNMNYFKS